MRLSSSTRQESRSSPLEVGSILGFADSVVELIIHMSS